MKWKVLIALTLIIGAAVGYKFYSESVESQTAKTYETAEVSMHFNRTLTE